MKNLFKQPQQTNSSFVFFSGGPEGGHVEPVLDPKQELEQKLGVSDYSDFVNKFTPQRDLVKSFINANKKEHRRALKGAMNHRRQIDYGNLYKTLLKNDAVRKAFLDMFRKQERHNEDVKMHDALNNLANEVSVSIAGETPPKEAHISVFEPQTTSGEISVFDESNNFADVSVFGDEFSTENLGKVSLTNTPSTFHQDVNIFTDPNLIYSEANIAGEQPVSFADISIFGATDPKKKTSEPPIETEARIDIAQSSDTGKNKVSEGDESEITINGSTDFASFLQQEQLQPAPNDINDITEYISTFDQENGSFNFQNIPGAPNGDIVVTFPGQQPQGFASIKALAKHARNNLAVINTPQVDGEPKEVSIDIEDKETKTGLLNHKNLKNLDWSQIPGMKPIDFRDEDALNAIINQQTNKKASPPEVKIDITPETNPGLISQTEFMQETFPAADFGNLAEVLSPEDINGISNEQINTIKKFLESKFPNEETPKFTPYNGRQDKVIQIKFPDKRDLIITSNPNTGTFLEEFIRLISKNQKATDNNKAIDGKTPESNPPNIRQQFRASLDMQTILDTIKKLDNPFDPLGTVTKQDSFMKMYIEAMEKNNAEQLSTEDITALAIYFNDHQQGTQEHLFELQENGKVKETLPNGISRTLEIKQILKQAHLAKQSTEILERNKE